MKKFLLALSILIISCHKPQVTEESPVEVYTQKYPYGTVMYVKPDSLKVVILKFDSIDNTYEAYWREGSRYADAWYSEEGFYGEADTQINISDE